MNSIDVVSPDDVHHDTQRIVLHIFFAWIEPEIFSISMDELGAAFGYVRSGRGRFGGEMARPVWIEPCMQLQPALMGFFEATAYCAVLAVEAAIHEVISAEAAAAKAVDAIEAAEWAVARRAEPVMQRLSHHSGEICSSAGRRPVILSGPQPAFRLADEAARACNADMEKTKCSATS